MSNITTIVNVLSSADKLLWSDALYLPANQEWTLDTSAIVWDPNDIENDDLDEPAIAIENNMKYVLSIADIQDIINNLRQQKNSTSMVELFDAFLYYCDNDAYIVF